MRLTTSLVLGFAAAHLALAPFVSAYSTGITGVARPAQGCTCHGIAGTTSDTTTDVSVVGLPDAYVPGTTYHLQAWVRGIALPAPRFAGFDLEATAGALHALDASAWVSGLDGQATHSAPKPVGLVGTTGIGSSWDIDWVAPNAGAGPVTFYLAGNVVNGIGVQTNADQGDIWSVANPGFVVGEAQTGATTTTAPPPTTTTTTTVPTVTTTTLAPAGASWPRRFFDAQNTANVGDDPQLTPANAPDLTLLATLPADGPATFGVTVVNHTPVVGDRLVFFGDMVGWFYVYDVSGLDAQPPTAPRLLLRVATHTAGPVGSSLGTYTGVQSTPNLSAGRALRAVARSRRLERPVLGDRCVHGREALDLRSGRQRRRPRGRHLAGTRHEQGPDAALPDGRRLRPEAAGRRAGRVTGFARSDHGRPAVVAPAPSGRRRGPRHRQLADGGRRRRDRRLPPDRQHRQGQLHLRVPTAARRAAGRGSRLRSPARRPAASALADLLRLRQPGRRLRCRGRGDRGTHAGGRGRASVRSACGRRRERIRRRCLHGRLQVGVELARRELRRGRSGERHVLHAGGEPARRGADGLGNRRARDAGDDEPQARAARHGRVARRGHAGRRRSGDRRREDLRAGAAGDRGRGGRRDRSRNVSGSAVLPGAAGERHLPRPVSRAVRARRAGKPPQAAGPVRLDGRRVNVRGPAAR